MHIDPILPTLVAIIGVVLLIGLSLQILRQPQVIGYLLAGVAIDPFGLALLSDTEFASRLGGFGVILLLFFVGMEVAPRQLISGWRIAVIGTLAQVVAIIKYDCAFGLPVQHGLNVASHGIGHKLQILVGIMAAQIVRFGQT